MYGFKNLTHFIGVVENNVDERLEGRVQVRAFGFHGKNTEIPTTALPWAILLSGSYDANVAIPPINSWVFGFFLDGDDAQQPMIMGMIPTQYLEPVNPDLNGVGSNNTNDYHLLSQGFRPEDYGQPQRSRLSRAEDLTNTYLAEMGATKVSDIKSADGNTWSEPGFAYNARYPFNRVIETAAGHSIELDDTPGAERIMIYHNSGSYLQVDAAGVKSDKATGDKYEINEKNMHVFVGGKCDIVVMGDAFLKVNGSMLEEVMGDKMSIVHGNYDLSVGGYSNMNISDEVQIRGARVAIEGKVEDVDIHASKKLNVTGLQGVEINSPKAANISGAEGIHIKGKGVNIESSESVDIKGEVAKVTSAGKLSLKGSVVAIDDVVQLSNGLSDDAAGANAAASASTAQMMEPPSKSVSGLNLGVGAGTGSVQNESESYRAIPVNNSMGGVGVDAYENSMGGDSSFISGCSTDLVAYISSKEGYHAKAFWDYKQYTNGYGTKALHANETISREEALSRLSSRISADRNFVQSYGRSKGYSWNDCQVDALTSFIFNLGTGTLDKLTAGGNRTNEQIGQAMLLYNGVVENGVKKVLSGLVSRRNDESTWFNTGSGVSTNVSGVMV